MLGLIPVANIVWSTVIEIIVRVMSVVWGTAIRVLLAAALVVATSGVAAAQANDCDPNPPTRTVRFQPTTTAIAFVSDTHTATDPDGSDIIVDYVGEVFVVGQSTPVSNWTIPKASLALQSGTPSNCFRTVLPAMAGLLPSNLYVVRVVARGQSGATAASVGSTDRFFLPGAPIAPGAPRLR